MQIGVSSFLKHWMWLRWIVLGGINWCRFSQCKIFCHWWLRYFQWLRYWWQCQTRIDGFVGNIFNVMGKFCWWNFGQCNFLTMMPNCHLQHPIFAFMLQILTSGMHCWGHGEVGVGDLDGGCNPCPFGNWPLLGYGHPRKRIWSKIGFPCCICELINQCCPIVLGVVRTNFDIINEVDCWIACWQFFLHMLLLHPSISQLVLGAIETSANHWNGNFKLVPINLIK